MIIQCPHCKQNVDTERLESAKCRLCKSNVDDLLDHHCQHCGCRLDEPHVIEKFTCQCGYNFAEGLVKIKRLRDCLICHEEIKLGEYVITTTCTTCRNIYYHKDCARPYIREHHKCPICHGHCFLHRLGRTGLTLRMLQERDIYLELEREEQDRHAANTGGAAFADTGGMPEPKSTKDYFSQRIIVPPGGFPKESKHVAGAGGAAFAGAGGMPGEFDGVKSTLPNYLKKRTFLMLN